MFEFRSEPPAIRNKECALKGLEKAREDGGLGSDVAFEVYGPVCAVGYMALGCGYIPAGDNGVLYNSWFFETFGAGPSSFYCENDCVYGYTGDRSIERLDHMIAFVEACPEIEENTP